ncbi:MAG: hypothetical protein WCI04_06950 [archaeon]
MKTKIKFLYEEFLKPFLIILVIAVACYLLFERGCSNPLIQDTTNPQIEKLKHEKDSIIKASNHYADSTNIVIEKGKQEQANLNASIAKIRQTNVIVVAALKKLTEDKSMQVFAKNNPDTTKPIKIEVEGKTRICVTPNQITQSNVCYEDKVMYEQLSDTLDNLTSLLLEESMNKSKIIAQKDKIIEAMKFKQESSNTEVQGLKDAVIIKDKEVIKQKRIALVFKGVSLALLILLAAK